jgi:hypothetical protein
MRKRIFNVLSVSYALFAVGFIITVAGLRQQPIYMDRTEFFASHLSGCARAGFVILLMSIVLMAIGYFRMCYDTKRRHRRQRQA